MELGEAEALGVLDDDDRCVADIDADLDHRGGDKHAGLALAEAEHGGVALGWFHASVGEADYRPEGLAKGRVAVLGGGDIEHLGFLDQRAYPVCLGALVYRRADAFDHLVEAFERQDAGLDRLAAGRLLGELGDVHVTVIGEHERARDRRCGHHQHVGGAAPWL